MAEVKQTSLFDELGNNKYGFHDPETFVFKSPKGLNADVVRQISKMKDEPPWMLEFRLVALDHFLKRPMPTWGVDLSGLDLDDIYYYVRPSESQGKSWDEVPDTIKTPSTTRHSRSRKEIPCGGWRAIRIRNGIP